MKQSWVRSLIYFIGVGGFVASAYVILATFLSQVGVATWLASAGSYLVLIPVGYIGQYRLAFASKSSHLTALPRYLLLQAVGLTLSWLLPLLLAQSQISPPLIFVSVAGSVAAINFILMKTWAFAPSNKEQVK